MHQLLLHKKHLLLKEKLYLCRNPFWKFSDTYKKSQEWNPSILWGWIFTYALQYEASATTAFFYSQWLKQSIRQGSKLLVSVGSWHTDTHTGTLKQGRILDISMNLNQSCKTIWGLCPLISFQTRNKNLLNVTFHSSSSKIVVCISGTSFSKYFCFSKVTPKVSLSSIHPFSLLWYIE